MSEGAGESISACLLTFNHVNIVGSTLDTVLAQSVRGFELIVSDDGSTDGTWELVRERARVDRRIRALRTPRNLGMAANANFAVCHSTRPSSVYPRRSSPTTTALPVVTAGSRTIAPLPAATSR